MGALVTILQAGSLIVSFIAPTVEAALKIKSLFELSPDFTVSVTDLAGQAISADEQTIAVINAWRAKQTPPLPPLVFPNS